MTRNIITTGDQFAKKGTQAWADCQRVRLRDALKDTNFEARQVAPIVKDMSEDDTEDGADPGSRPDAANVEAELAALWVQTAPADDAEGGEDS